MTTEITSTKELASGISKSIFDMAHLALEPSIRSITITHENWLSERATNVAPQEQETRRRRELLERSRTENTVLVTDVLRDTWYLVTRRKPQYELHFFLNGTHIVAKVALHADLTETAERLSDELAKSAPKSIPL